MLIAALVIAVTTVVTPPMHRVVLVAPYASAAEAIAFMDTNTSVSPTGLREAPLVTVSIVYADLVLQVPGIVETNYREFKAAKSRMSDDAMAFYSRLYARSKGVVTTSEHTVVVWWIK